jgi:hypothetical protein
MRFTAGRAMRAAPLLLVTLGCAKVADRNAAPAAHLAAQTATPPPPPRTKLLGNLGSYHRVVTTTSPEAQQFFDEGLTLLYGFNHAEAFRSFERAAALDTAAPMPHWGMSLALGTNINDLAPAERLKSAYHHLASAIARRANGSAVEQGLLTRSVNATSPMQLAIRCLVNRRTLTRCVRWQKRFQATLMSRPSLRRVS